MRPDASFNSRIYVVANKQAIRKLKHKTVLNKLLNDDGQVITLRIRQLLAIRHIRSSGSYVAAVASYHAAGNFGYSNLRRIIKITKLQIKYILYRNYFYQHRKKNIIAVIWNGMKNDQGVYSAAAKKEKIPTIYLELAPLADCLAIDRKGVNYKNALPRNINFYYEWASKNNDAPNTSWKTIGESLKARSVEQLVGLKQDPINDQLKEDQFIFFPMQLFDDSQLTVFGGWASTKEVLFATLKQLSEILPDGWHLRVKEHPSARKSFIDPSQLSSDKLVLDTVSNSLDLVKFSKVVLTINSSIGFESMLLEKPVVTLGKSFYGFSDLTIQAHNITDLLKLFQKPENITFNEQSRNVFLRYIIEEQFFPSMEAILAGKWTLQKNLPVVDH